MVWIGLVRAHISYAWTSSYISVLDIFWLLSSCVYVFYVSLCGSSRGTLRCDTSIFDNTTFMPLRSWTNLNRIQGTPRYCMRGKEILLWLPWAEIWWKVWMKILVTGRQWRWQNHHTTDKTKLDKRENTDLSENINFCTQNDALKSDQVKTNWPSDLVLEFQMRKYQSENPSQWDNPSC